MNFSCHNEFYHDKKISWHNSGFPPAAQQYDACIVIGQFIMTPLTKQFTALQLMPHVEKRGPKNNKQSKQTIEPKECISTA